MLLPQDCSPPLTTAQLWFMPAATEVTLLPAAIACTGTRLFVVFPLPSWPRLFRPQHRAPPLTTAQLWFKPAATEVTLLPAAIACAGTRLRVALPLPSWP